MADKLSSDIERTNAAFSKMDRLLLKLLDTASKIGPAFSGAFKSVGGTGFGSRNLGVGSQNIMANSFGNMSTAGMLGQARFANMGFAAARGGLQAATGIIGGAFMAMPDVAATTAMSTAYYDANVMAGMGRNGRNRIALGTFNSMKGGITSPGSPGIVSANLLGMGVQYSSAEGSQYQTLTRSVAGAAKYLNIENAVASQALGGLTSGGTSSSLMRNFGIYTTNPVTGKRLSPTEIFAQLNERMTGGQKLSRKDLLTSFQGGALGENLRLSGLDQTQQQLALQYMLDASEGKNMDLSDEKLMARLQKEAGINPQQSIMSANTSQTATMQTASDAYIEGMKKAAAVLDTFNKAMQGFLRSPAGQAMAQLNSGMSLAMGDPTVAGGLTAAGGLLGGMGTIGGAAIGGAMISRMLSKNGVNAAPALGGKGGKLPKGWKMGKDGKVMKPNAKGTGYVKATKGELAAVAKSVSRLKGLGKAVPILGTALTGFSLFDNISRGDWRGVWGDVGGILGGVGAAAGLTAATGGVGILGSTAAYAGGSYVGSMAGEGLYDTLFGGQGGESNANGLGSSSGAGAPKLVHPVPKGSKVTGGWTTKDPLHPNGHKGIDFGVAPGTTVMAAADGEVIYAAGDAQNTFPSGSRGWGINVQIRHAGGWKTIYGHLSSPKVSVGTKVVAGQVIGLSGNSGYSSGPHLHFELQNSNGSPVNPASLLGVTYVSPIDGQGDQTSSAGSVMGSAGSGSGAGDLGFSSGATTASGIKYPAPYKGAGGSSTLVTAQVSNGTSDVLGHGASTTMSGGASVGTGMGGGSNSGGGNNITINVTVAQASESEARRFAQLIKQYIDDDAVVAGMGRM